MKGCGRSGPNHPKSRGASGTMMPSTDHPDSSQNVEVSNVLVVMQRHVSLRRKAWRMKLTCRVSTKLSSSKPQILLDSIQRRMKDKDNFMIEGEQMMSCFLTNETRQTAQRLAPAEERNCRVGGKRTESSKNYNVHSLRNGLVEALAKLSTMR